MHNTFNFSICLNFYFTIKILEKSRIVTKQIEGWEQTAAPREFLLQIPGEINIYPKVQGWAAGESTHKDGGHTPQDDESRSPPKASSPSVANLLLVCSAPPEIRAVTLRGPHPATCNPWGRGRIRCSRPCQTPGTVCSGGEVPTIKSPGGAWAGYKGPAGFWGGSSLQLKLPGEGGRGLG